MRCIVGCLCVYAYLLLILPLQVQPGLDVSSGLLEGLPLGHLGGVVGADADDVSAQEDQDVGAHLERRERREERRRSSLRYEEERKGVNQSGVKHKSTPE